RPDCGPGCTAAWNGFFPPGFPGGAAAGCFPPSSRGPKRGGAPQTPPPPPAAAAWCAAVTATAILLSAAGLALLAAGVAGAAGITVAVVLADRNSAALPAARGAVGSWILGVLGSSEELAAVGAADWVLAQLAERERALGTHTRAVAAATGLGRVSVALAGGAGLAGVAWTGAAAERSGRISPVELGVLVFMA